MRRGGRTSDMAGALQGVLKSAPASAKIWESLAFAYWPAIVGSAAAKATDLESIIDGALYVRTNSSVWSHELSLMKSHLIAQLNETIGRPVIKDIRFKVKKVVKAEIAAPVAEELPDEVALKQVPLPPDEQAALAQDLLEAESITNDEIRASVIERMIRTRRLNVWLVQHGRRLCSECRSPFQGDETLCPYCRKFSG